MIVLKNAVKRINDRYILDQVSFTFEKNVSYVINGTSGAGKTTLLNLIAGYDQLDSGSISIREGAAIQYLFQESLLFSNLTVAENMYIKWLSKKQNEEERFQTLMKKSLSMFFVEDLIDKKISTLSGGEKQRVELAQIFLCSPAILLLDEPTSNLDYENKLNMIKCIDEAFPQTTKIVVSHEDREIFQGYKHLSLSEGRLAYEA